MHNISRFTSLLLLAQKSSGVQFGGLSFALSHALSVAAEVVVKTGSKGKEIFHRPLHHLKTLLAPPSSRAPLERHFPLAVKPHFSLPLFAVFGLVLQL
jgi:hypothetical protein